MVLVDTSVWIEVFRRNTALRLSDHADFEAIATCLPVVQEVLQGFRDERAFRVARDAMLAVPIVESPLTLQTIEDAVQLFRSARRIGLTVRSSVDCLIGACALRHDLTVLHLDRDFEALARVAPLKVQSIRPRGRP